MALTVIGTLTGTTPARAVVIAEESFDYEAGTQLKGANGGTGWDGAWFVSPSVRSDNQVAAGSLTYDGLTRRGNRMKQIGGDVRSFRKIDTSRKEVAPFVVDGEYGKTFGKDGTTIWISFLISVSSYPKVAYGGIHLCDGLGDLTKDPFGDKKAHQRISLGRSNMSKHWYLGRVTNGGPRSGKWESNVRADDTVRFLVYRFDLKEGDETAYLFIDPVPGKEPDVKTAAITATNVSDFRFNTLSVGAGGGAEFFLDEIRIGTEFKDVAPAAK
jgi:hypothetical protein